MSFERMLDVFGTLLGTKGERAPLDERGRVLRVVGKDENGKPIYEPTGKRPLTRKQVRAAVRAEFSPEDPDLQHNVLGNAEQYLPGYGQKAQVPASERSKRAALSEKARDAMLDYTEECVYDIVPSDSPLIRRPDGPVQRFVQHVLGMDLDDRSLGGISYREMRESRDPVVRQRYHLALLERVLDMMEQEVNEISSLTDEEAVARYARTKAFNNVVFEVESIFDNEGLFHVEELKSLRDTFKRNQNGLSMATTRVELIANPLYRDLSIEKTMSYGVINTSALGIGFESADKSPAGKNRADFFKIAGMLSHTALSQRAQYLCNLLKIKGFDPEMPEDYVATAFLTACDVRALRPDGQRVTGEDLQSMMDGFQPVLLEIPEHDGRPAELISVLPGSNPYDVRLHENSPEAYFNFAAEDRIAALTQQLLDADKRVFSGSKEFAGMAHAMTMLGEHFVSLQEDGNGYQQIKDLLDELNERSTEYLTFKESQRGLQDGKLVGKNDTEQRRIEAAQQVQQFVQEKLGQLQLLSENAVFRKTMNADEPEAIANAADTLSKSAQPSKPLGALENAAARSARELSRMALWGDPPTTAEQADARMHMARMVVNEVVHMQGEHGPMMSLYNQSPAKFLNDYANSKEFKAIAGDPEKIGAFMQHNGAKTMAENIVASLAAKMNDAPKPKPQPSKEMSGPTGLQK